MLARNNPAIRSLIERIGESRTITAVTSVGCSFLVPDVPVEVAGRSIMLPVSANPSSQQCGKGLPGADVLRHCTLVWGSSSLWAACRAPAERRP
jgi:hypothetical protein